MKIQVKNGSETVIFESIDQIINSECEVNTSEFCLSKTIETKLEKQAFEILKEKIESKKYKLLLQGVQIVLVLDIENKRNLKKELRKCVECIDSIIDQIRLDIEIERIVRSKACVLGNMIESELRVLIYS